MTRKQKIQHCKEFAPSLEEMDELIDNSPPQLKAAQVLLFSGLRVGEVAHAQSSWIHIGDKQAIHEGDNYIDIPKLGPICDCWDCMLQAYLEYQQRKHPEQHSTIWFQKKQKKFYRIKKEFKEYIKEQKNKYPGEHSDRWYKRKQHAFFRKKGLEDLNKYQWSPKTNAGVRYIWLLNDEHNALLKEFFSNNETIGLNRRQIYERVKSLGYKILHKKVFPHAERSSAATRLAYNGANEATSNNQMGWVTNLSKDYVGSNSKLALLDLKSKLK